MWENLQPKSNPLTKMAASIALLIILVGLHSFSFARSGKPPTAANGKSYSGAPGESTCLSCHGNSSNGSLIISDLPDAYQEDLAYTIKVKLSQSGRKRWGFVMTALDTDGNQAGTFETADVNTQTFSSGGRQYIGHTPTGTAVGKQDSQTWTLRWIAPASGLGNVTFYASGNAANGNGATGGDNGYQTQATIQLQVKGVDIPDPNLRAVLEGALGKNEGDVITKEDLAKLNELKAENRKISDLTGLEHCIGLTYLNLNHNQISNLSPLTNLTNLVMLELHHNQLTQLDVLASANLPSLDLLSLQSNQISDLKGLADAKLPNLKALYLHDNQLKDLNTLANVSLPSLELLSLTSNQLGDLEGLVTAKLPNLARLYLNNNRIKDLSGLAKLGKLKELNLHNNQISDVSKLAGHTGISDEVNLKNNPLNSAALFTHIPVLKARGITVEYDMFDVLVTFKDHNLEKGVRDALGIPTGQLKKSDVAKLKRLHLNGREISDLTGLEHFINLTNLELKDNQISDISALANLTSLTWLKLNNVTFYLSLLNEISDLSPLTNLTNLTYLDLSGFRGNRISDLSPLSNLTNLTYLDLKYNYVINDLSPLANLTNLTNLELHSNQISDVSPLSNLTNLTDLDLSLNKIRNLSALSNLTNLTNLKVLNLANNQISDLSPLANLTNLTNLTVLGLGGNRLTDLSGLANLTDLTSLNLGINQISGLSSLANLTNLTELHLLHNQVSDISPLANLTNLTYLRLYENQISDLSPLANLTNLTVLDLSDNQLTDLSGLANLINLSSLQLSVNQIRDLSPLADLTNLTEVWIYDNQISDLSPLANLINLKTLNLNLNKIRDLSPLVNNGGIKGNIYLKDNPLSRTSVLTHIPALKARGITVEFDYPAVWHDEQALVGDVNGDNQVDLFDLVQVASMFGKKGEGLASDVSGDGQVDLFDLVQVAGNFGKSNEAAAPTVLSNKLTFTTQQRRSIQSAIVELEGISARSQAEELVLNLLIAILPDRLPEYTQLLPNYPNPFNPETWIPFELSQDSEVSVTIYDVAGAPVRNISVGYLEAGRYVSQSKSVYWDGKTDTGKRVASGIYLYQIQAGDYIETRKMVILK